MINEVNRHVRLFKRIVDREHHTVFSHRFHRATEGSVGTYTGRCDRNVSFDVERRRLRKRTRTPIRHLPSAVKAPKIERKSLAHVAQHQPCFRIALEYTTKHEPQCVRRSLECPTANRTPKFRMPGIHCRVIHWIVGMKIDRRFKRRGALSPYSASEVTSLGSRFYGQVDGVGKHKPTSRY